MMKYNPRVPNGIGLILARSIFYRRIFYSIYVSQLCHRQRGARGLHLKLRFPQTNFPVLQLLGRMILHTQFAENVCTVEFEIIT